MGSARPLAQVYRRFAEAGHPDASPLYKRVALALSESDQALRAIESAPARRRNPAVILAALHDLALAGRAPALAAADAPAADAPAADAPAADAPAADAPAAAAIDTLLHTTDAVADIAVRRPVRADETGRHAVLYPAIAEAARRAGAKAVGLIDIGRSAGLNLNVDRVGVTYANGPSLGDPSSRVQVSSRIAQRRPVPSEAIPEVVARCRLNPPKPSAAAGRGAASWRGWQTPRHGGSSGCHRIRPEVARCVRAVA